MPELLPIPDAIGAIYAAAADPSLWPAALTRLADATGGLGGMMVHNLAPDRGGFCTVGRLRDDLSRLYQQRYYDNPYSHGLAAAPPGQPVIASAWADMERVRRSALQADVLAPQRIVEMVCLTHPAFMQSSSSGGFSVVLDSRQAADAGRVVRRMARLAPHLGRALDLGVRLGATPGAPQMAAMLDRMTGAALLLDGLGRILQANAMAEALLRQTDGLSVEAAGGLRLRLRAAIPSEQRALAQRLRQGLATAAGQDEAPGGPLRLTRPSGRPALLLLAFPLPPAAFEPWQASGHPRLLVLVVEPEAPLQASAALLREAFGLTGAEARVAWLIAGGMSVPQAAARLGVSPATVKTHLAGCFGKTGLRSQTSLARLLSALPPASRRP
ncbi:helix-turn-helix transcriptional regulator [Roseomonas sp. OT10]|uniref:helix-turn-helix transcriptional regulator n=1 Tax=Roseomonas cutis TaxID=2897332 RepID=UPI001E456269|nr:helix-turn-helix transcriptional regulator [Roseomonas sp. OT10]UFN49653.1 helix-turn-helix transcriptional regulator [Roseomonas sp. OT10]